MKVLLIIVGSLVCGLVDSNPHAYSRIRIQRPKVIPATPEVGSVQPMMYLQNPSLADEKPEPPSMFETPMKNVIASVTDDSIFMANDKDIEPGVMENLDEMNKNYDDVLTDDDEIEELSDESHDKYEGPSPKNDELEIISDDFEGRSNNAEEIISHVQQLIEEVQKLDGSERSRIDEIAEKNISHELHLIAEVHELDGSEGSGVNEIVANIHPVEEKSEIDTDDKKIAVEKVVDIDVPAAEGKSSDAAYKSMEGTNNLVEEKSESNTDDKKNAVKEVVDVDVPAVEEKSSDEAHESLEGANSFGFSKYYGGYGLGYGGYGYGGLGYGYGYNAYLSPYGYGYGYGYPCGHFGCKLKKLFGKY